MREALFIRTPNPWTTCCGRCNGTPVTWRWWWMSTGVPRLVTLEDLVEEVIGESPTSTTRTSRNPFPCRTGVPGPGPMSVGELGDLFGLELDDEEVETVGGLLTKALGRCRSPGPGPGSAGSAWRRTGSRTAETAGHGRRPAVRPGRGSDRGSRGDRVATSPRRLGADGADRVPVRVRLSGRAAERGEVHPDQRPGRGQGGHHLQSPQTTRHTIRGCCTGRTRSWCWWTPGLHRPAPCWGSG
jgi:hypothetical protein